MIHVAPADPRDGTEIATPRPAIGRRPSRLVVIIRHIALARRPGQSPAVPRIDPRRAAIRLPGAIALCLLLGACSGGAPVVVGLPPPVSAANSAPVIAGTPGTSVEAGQPYVFQPTAYDPDGQRLQFTITGLPAWARFDSATGRLSGTPSVDQSGIYAGITVGVSDGTAAILLPTFSITVALPPVAPPPSGTGTAQLNWTIPSQNVDGSPLTNLSGYQIYSGRTAATLSRLATIDSASITAYRVDGLLPGTHYFAVSALSASGLESALSGIASKTIP